MAQLLRLGGVEGLARQVTASGSVQFRVEIDQPHIDAKGRQRPAERAVTAARIERNSRQVEPQSRESERQADREVWWRRIRMSNSCAVGEGSLGVS